MNSHNHPMLGSVGAWFYRHLAGLQYATTTVGGDCFRIAPQFVQGLNKVSAALETARGRLECGWERREGAIVLRILVPVGSRANVELPAPQGAAGITESGRPLQEVEGVADVIVDRVVLRFSVASGRYCFAMA